MRRSTNATDPSPSTACSPSGHQPPICSVKTANAVATEASTRSSRRIGGMVFARLARRAFGTVWNDVLSNRAGVVPTRASSHMPTIHCWSGASPVGAAGVQVARSDALVRNEPGIRQHFQVPTHRRSSNREISREFSNGPWTISQQFPRCADAPARRGRPAQLPRIELLMSNGYFTLTQIGWQVTIR